MSMGLGTELESPGVLEDAADWDDLADGRSVELEGEVPCDRLTLLDEIGRGGMGIVLRGRDAVLGRDVAVKVLRDRLGDRP
jgi:hypothetical protein